MYVLVDDTPGIGSIGYDSDYQAVVVTWLKNDNALFQSRLESELELVTRHGLLTVIVDTSEVKGALSETNQQWLTHNFFPRLSKSGLKALVSVAPQSALSMLVNKRSFGSAAVPFDMVSVSTLEEAYAAAGRIAIGQPAAKR